MLENSVSQIIGKGEEGRGKKSPEVFETRGCQSL